MADKPTIIPYQRSYVELQSIKPVSKIKTTPLSKINGNIVFLHLVAFLLGRAGILQGLTPFGIAFFTALSQRDRKYGLIGITTFIGIVTVQGLTSSIPYGFALAVIYCLFQYVLDIRKTKVFKASVIGAVAYLLTTALFLSFTGFFIYDWIMVAFEAVVIFVVVYISSYAIPVALQNTNRKILSTEEIICIAILTALVLSGINEVYIVGLSLRNILGILMTILFAYNGGASIGASVGITLGLITSMSTGSTPVIIGIFGFSGLLAGIFKDIGKIGSALGFLMGNAILTFYINGYYEIFIQFKEVAIAFVLFLVLPSSWISQMEKFCNTRTGILNSSKTHSDRTRKLTYERLRGCATTFSDLSTTFEKISQKEELFANEDLSKLIEKVANDACHSCGMKRSCWDQNFNTTYQGMLDMLIHIEEKSILHYDDLPKHLQKRCIRPKAVMEKIAHLYELSYLNMVWKQRLIESRELVGGQLKGVAEVIDELARNVNEEVQFDLDLEDAIYVALDKAGLSVKNIVVSNNEKGNLEIVVDKKQCYNRDICRERFIPIVSEAVGTGLVKKSRSCNKVEGSEGCSFTLVEANKYATCTKSAVAIKEGNKLSGDSHTFMELRNGQYMTALSDGMGTGDKAHLQSSATIDMLEKMMDAGFHREVAIKTINSMLMLKSSEEMFASLDLTLIDLYKGSADFIKIGSSPSFIKRQNGKIEEITSSTLPIGILNDIQIEGNVQNLEDGDLIITVSDGIIDSNQEAGEKWLIEFLKNVKSLNPQEVADGILHHALGFTQNIATDDLTVLVTKIWEIN
jgi:stage II sporulation protein E